MIENILQFDCSRKQTNHNDKNNSWDHFLLPQVSPKTNILTFWYTVTYIISNLMHQDCIEDHSKLRSNYSMDNRFRKKGFNWISALD